MNQLWLTTSDWPVSAFVSKEFAVGNVLEHHVLDMRFDPAPIPMRCHRLD
jgi:hypothetical protein